MTQPVKNALLQWVDDQTDLDVTTKFILNKLAAYADAECCAWCEVSTLSKACNVSVRTVQYRLGQLRKLGMISPTGEMHRLKDSTRSVPIYQLAPGVAGLGADERAVSAKAQKAKAERAAALSMGAKSAPIEQGYGCKTGGGMGASCCTRIEPKNLEERSSDLSKRARDPKTVDLFGAEAGMGEAKRRFREAYHPSARTSFSAPAFEASWARALAHPTVAGDAERLISAAARFAAEWEGQHHGFVARSYHRWLGEEGFVAHLSDAGGELRLAGVAPASAAGEVYDGPQDLRAQLVAVQGEGRFGAYLGRARWDARASSLTLPHKFAFDTVRGDAAAMAVLKQHGVTLAWISARHSKAA